MSFLVSIQAIETIGFINNMTTAKLNSPLPFFPGNCYAPCTVVFLLANTNVVSHANLPSAKVRLF